MAVLIEALSLVIPRIALDISWPGGSDAFLHAMCEPDCLSRRVCADDTLASISFFNPEDALPTEQRLEDIGLLGVVDDAFHDFAFVDQRTGPTMPCPWLHWRQHRDGYTYAWREGSDSSTMAAPADWTPEQSRRLVRTDIRDDTERMLKLSDDGKFEIWLDYQTGEMSRGLARSEPETKPEPKFPIDKIIAELDRVIRGPNSTSEETHE